MWKFSLGICAAVIVAYLAWQFLPEYFREKEDPRSAEHLGKVAADLNRAVPVMIDADTELLPAEGRQAMLIYNYRLVNYRAAQLDGAKLAANIRQKVMPAACNRPETRDEFLKKGVTLRYSYLDKDKQPVAAVDVTPKDCGF